MIPESLTQELIGYQYAKTWNGELPTAMLGSDTAPVLNMDSTGTEE